MQVHRSATRVVAVLGPTNTGKTHLAIERMLGHRSGMIGFPLRLLARENYDRIVRLKGEASVALITGEERIVPSTARWFVCTVESMPVDKPVAFLAVDEIQLCADQERGHIFTDRLLHARGHDETMFLGAETMKAMIKRLVPEVEIITRPRLSTLSYAGMKKLTRLPRRSAIVAFSAADVYETAELMRRSRGGCAVVLGALSPRARNAQVELYQSGEVDYMVATDAIGMGLNMDLDHVCFARLSKFDGRSPRRLTAPEMAQIAGRAGRHQNDGTFGTTTEVGELDADLIEQIETHRFDPIEALSWRNPNLDFRSLPGLLASLDRGPPSPVLKKKREADDHLTLMALSRIPEIADDAKKPQRLRILWDVCQIPDFRKTMTDAHTRLLHQIYSFLSAPGGRLPSDWVAAQIARLDMVEGDIDQLSQRLAHIRTWTYVSHRPEWVRDAGEWQANARAIEDKLSDALHEKLTQRFVDRRGAHLIRRMDGAGELLAGITAEGEVVVEGHPVGRLDGFTFHPDEDAVGLEAKRLLTAARRALGPEIARRVTQFTKAEDDSFSLMLDGKVRWKDAEVARLVPGPRPLAPGLDLLVGDILEGEGRMRVQQRLAKWLQTLIERELQPLMALRDVALGGLARGLAFQLHEAFGVLPRSAVGLQLSSLPPADAKALGRLGVRFGIETIYLEPLLKPQPMALKCLLQAIASGLSPIPQPPGGPLGTRDDSLPDLWYRAAAMVLLGPRFMRVDLLERLSMAARKRAKNGPFAADDELVRLAGCRPGEIAAVLAALGYKAKASEAGVVFCARRRKKTPPPPPNRVPTERTDSPFAKLKEMMVIR
ncbi:helicase-related protein [Lacibacterium aquatile]|uniref:Helicase-related protein n=1 Tax=Lacibacterium aquatile TaxID=1168082 RepID=A0ABW5DTI0_9PROT